MTTAKTGGGTGIFSETYRVTGIWDSAFSDCSSLTSVTIPNSVTYIGQSAFKCCSGLTSVTIPDSVTYIRSKTFSGCNSLAHVTMPDSVTSIESQAFSGCSSLTNMTIPDSVTSIGWQAFGDCSGLTRVMILGNVTNDWPNSLNHPFYNCTRLATLVLGEKMTKIGNYMFYGCSGLTRVTIPNGVVSIEDCAFSGCSSLESFSVASDNPAFKSVDGLLLTKDGKTLLCGVNGDVVIPDGVTDLSTYAFRDCSELTSVTIPNSVVRLPTEAFDGCDKLWTSWYRTLANLAASGGASGGSSSGGSGRTVSLSVTNVIVHYVTQSIQSDMVVPNTNSTGIVNIVAEVVANKAVAIPSAWAEQYPAFGEIYGTDLSAALTMQTGKQDGAGKPVFVWQDYVAGTDPTDLTSVFTASVT